MAKLIGTAPNQVPVNAHLSRTAYIRPEDLPVSNAARAELDGKVDKVEGKQLSTEDYTTADRNKLITIQEGAQVNPIPVTNLASTDDTVPLAASQGKVLKDLIDQINALLQSDDASLDELQEIVDFIKLNRADLEALGIDSIAGLRTALDGKQPLSSILTGTTASFTTALKNKLDAIATQATKNETDAYLLSRANHTGTQAISTVTGLQTALDGKEGKITAGTAGQYWRGDKSWQTLNKAAVGLGNVDNTSDASKPVSTATQNALDGKVSKSGDTMTGQLKIGTAAAIRLKDGPGSEGRAFILQKNLDILYFLVTDNNDADGGPNSLRPLYINLVSGAVTINGGTPWTTANLNTGVGTDQVPKNSDFYQSDAGSWRVIRFPRKYQKLSYRITVDLTGITWSGSSSTHRFFEIGIGTGVPFPFPFSNIPVCTVGGFDANVGSRSAWISYVGYNTTTIQSIYITAVGTSPPTGSQVTINLEFSGIGT